MTRIGCVAATDSGREAAAYLKALSLQTPDLRTSSVGSPSQASPSQASPWPYEVEIIALDSVADSLRAAFRDCDAVVAFLATGATVRILAPLLAHKTTDAPVVCVDEGRRYAVALLGGHYGANDLARHVATALAAQPVISNARDAEGINPLPPLPEQHSPPRPTPLPAPARRIVVGVGASRGVSAEEVLETVDAALAHAGVPAAEVSALATVDLKADEPGILSAAELRGWPLTFHPAAELVEVEVPNPSEVVRAAVGTPSVAEAAARNAGPGRQPGRLLAQKTRSTREYPMATAAVAEHNPQDHAPDPTPDTPAERESHDHPSETATAPTANHGYTPDVTPAEHESHDHASETAAADRANRHHAPDVTPAEHESHDHASETATATARAANYQPAPGATSDISAEREPRDHPSETAATGTADHQHAPAPASADGLHPHIPVYTHSSAAVPAAAGLDADLRGAERVSPSPSRSGAVGSAVAGRGGDPLAQDRVRQSGGPGVRGRLAVIGLGPGARDLTAPRALAELRAAEVVVGLDQYVEQIRDVLSPDVRIEATGLGAEEQRARSAVDLARAGYRVALIGSGDAGVYAMASPALDYVETADIEVVCIPGITAATAASNVLGAPLGHDHCSISLSDLHTPWPAIERRVRAAAEGDFVVSFYNPRSAKRDWQLPKALAVLGEHRPDSAPVGWVRNAGRPDQSYGLTTLAEFDPAVVDMYTTVIVGCSQSRIVAGRFVTPRGYRWAEQ